MITLNSIFFHTFEIVVCNSTGVVITRYDERNYTSKYKDFTSYLFAILKYAVPINISMNCDANGLQFVISIHVPDLVWSLI